MKRGSEHQNITERVGGALTGYAFAVLTPIAFVAMCAAIVNIVQNHGGWLSYTAAALCFLATLTFLAGLYVLEPKQAAVLMLFGRYVGTDRGEGLRWANPLAEKMRISVRANTFTTEQLKVNDMRGNPIEIAATIIWVVRDTASATFNVEDYNKFVAIQADAAVRNIAARYPYDNLDPDGKGNDVVTLRSGAETVSTELQQELQAKFEQAGIAVLDAKIMHLAYAPEIAGAMLRRQQAEAVVAAREKVVMGAVGMVEAALQALKDRDVIDLDPERKAAMVSNLLVVLCADRDATPVVNTGTLYA